ncbi:hypothetical protein [Flavobacterium sp.]|uniref:hypothetical protein n=1 Tax=Flavobacterium sp. TaxID=239 RepID=UPI00286F8287|nr:hypothetical protein [Flavobacterium sp.]
MAGTLIKKIREIRKILYDLYGETICGKEKLNHKERKASTKTQSYIYLTRWLKLVFNDNFTSVRVIFERKSYREQVKFH